MAFITVSDMHNCMQISESSSSVQFIPPIKSAKPSGTSANTLKKSVVQKRGKRRTTARTRSYDFRECPPKKKIYVGE